MSGFTQAQLDAMDRMIASGVLESEYDGNRIKYRSMADLIRARDMVRNGLGNSAATRVTHVQPTYCRGT
jgi:hypothetical protein